RKGLSPLAEVAKTIAESLRPFEGPMLPVLARAVRDLTGVRVPPDAWNLSDLPPYLRFYFRVTDRGKPLAEALDLVDLRDRAAAVAREAWGRRARPSWAREGLTSWSFEALPEHVTVEIDGHRLFAYPALVDTESSVALRPLPSLAAAAEATRAGL